MNNIDKVLNAKLNEKIFIDNSNYIEQVYFFQDNHDKFYSYCYNLTSSYNYRTMYPFASSNNIKIFKTLIGAKRNFIKQHLEDKIKE